MPSRFTDTPMLERVTSGNAAGSDVSKPHRVRFRGKARSATASSLSSSVPPSSSGTAPRPRVHVDDGELCARAEVVARAMDFRGLAGSNEAGPTWALKKSRGTFTTYARRPDATTTMRTPTSALGPGNSSGKTRPTQQVLAAGEIRCHLQEVVHVLNTNSDFEHNAVMSGLYRKDFIYGSVVHVVPSDVVGDEPKLVELLEADESTTTQVAVKTGTFVHSKMFAPNEQWCFLEQAQHVRGATPGAIEAPGPAQLNSFTLTLSSLDEKDLEAGKVNGHGRVNMLHGMSAGYLVEQLPGSKYVRVLFFGQFDAGDVEKPRQAGSSQMRARLVRLADGATRLPEVVRRRRFGAQTMADRAAFPANNAHCICCTRSLRLLTRKHRCHLCGHHVCDRCWSVQEMETQNTRRITPVRVCSRCIEFVENGDYSAVKPSSLGSLEVKRDPVDRPPPTKTLARLLQSELRSASGARKNSVRTVIQYLVNQEAQEEQAKAERQAKADAEARSIRLTSDSADQEYLKALDGGLSIHQVPLYKCILANATKRNYPITMPKTAANGSTPDAPIPVNEKERLTAIARSRVLELGDASELDMLCSLAAGQLDCNISIVTVVTADQMMVLGSNKEDLRRVSLPREHSFCQHTVMTSKPLLVPHPEADVRFQNISGRTAFDVRFYCGFPIVDADNTVIGSLCCMDQKTHEMTQSQYSAMKKLASAAGLVVRSKYRERLA
ncbi:hypothetical protein PHYPSEUDO_002184 [Phytophthora pseudosyringae]|uniref:FYVE-type domain-containing protein n=1 Tax=Phytophthora pseudosyringae TaxID=221518 RepID=A0A8T1VY00_9STRA|nr:hypothetical protein PHYPSEUDO_002184 [Phytophthora pseudosyringae]